MIFISHDEFAIRMILIVNKMPVAGAEHRCVALAVAGLARGAPRGLPTALQGQGTSSKELESQYIIQTEA